MSGRMAAAAVAAGLAALVLGCAPGAGGAARKTPEPLFNPEPVYPEAALESRQAGEVVVAVMVDEMGLSKDVRVLSEEPPGKGFGQAAQDAVTTWIWSPAIMDGTSVGESVRMAVRFNPARPRPSKPVPALRQRTECASPEPPGPEPEPLAVAEVDVRPDGTPAEVRVIRVTPDGERLARAAKACIENWRWAPGQPGTTCVVVHFTTAGAEAEGLR